MSLGIDIDRVAAVLLADGWHEVKNQSFAMDAYEFLWYPDPDDRSRVDVVHGGGDNGICATGFEFEADDELIYSGPLTSILAVRYHTAKEAERRLREGDDTPLDTRPPNWRFT